MLKRTDYLTKRYGLPDSHTLATYEKDGGYQMAKKALSMDRAALVDEMKAANIRGRGGAGFPMGVKWSFMPWPPKPEKPHYLVINADEGEPGTFKDRTLMEQDPHSVVEGCIIGCKGIGAHAAYIYVRDELHLSKDRLWGAIREARAKGYLGARPFGIDYPVDVYVHTGAGAYICGEETALLNSLEGKRGEPRLKPPFPAQVGAFGMPSTVNNLETIAATVPALRMGGDAFSKLSDLHHLKDGGTRLFGVSGHVKTPGVWECAVGLTLRELIFDLGGGMLEGNLLAVIPGGSSCPILRPEEIVNAPDEKSPLHPWHGKSVLDVPMGVDTFRTLGTMLGTCCAIVLSDRACPVLAFHNLMRFYRHESCGQCTPCREGGAWLNRILTRIVEGEATLEELDRLHEIADNIMGNTICAFGEGTAMPALGFLKKFRRELEDFVRTKGKSSTGRRAARPRRGGGHGGRAQPHPRGDGPARGDPRDRGDVPASRRRVPRRGPGHRLRGRGRHPLPLRHHAPRPVGHLAPGRTKRAPTLHRRRRVLAERRERDDRGAAPRQGHHHDHARRDAGPGHDRAHRRGDVRLGGGAVRARGGAPLDCGGGGSRARARQAARPDGR
jgi:NADH-quinone oxidoreductase subunit F